MKTIFEVEIDWNEDALEPLGEEEILIGIVNSTIFLVDGYGNVKGKIKQHAEEVS